MWHHRRIDRNTVRSISKLFDLDHGRIAIRRDRQNRLITAGNGNFPYLTQNLDPTVALDGLPDFLRQHRKTAEQPAQRQNARHQHNRFHSNFPPHASFPYPHGPTCFGANPFRFRKDRFKNLPLRS
jgi:hypothetical protein